MGNNNSQQGKRRKNIRKRDSDKKRKQKKYPNLEICSICENEIRDVLNAISYGENHAPVHFDCVLQNLRETEELKRDEKIVYLGKGSFGIIQFRNPPSPIRFFVRKRIQIEDIEKKPEWRKKMAEET
ncbi:MAG: hypothetical protein ACLFR1_06035 [Spirochaetia bacterium]